MKYLVTGGAGFIGSNLVDRLINDGHEVTVIDNESSDAHDQFYWNSTSKNYKYDINDYIMTRELYEGVDAVFHIAAEARIQNCVEDPIKAVETNTLGTATVLECARKCGVERVIYSSTSAAYGMIPPPHSEWMSPDCLNPYTTTKVAGEELCKMYSKMYGLKTIIFRYFNVYGNRQPVRGQYAPVIGIFQRQKKNNETLTIVGDGEQRRDFVNVLDVVTANILASKFTPSYKNFEDIDGMKKYTTYEWGSVYNIGTGMNHSINEIASIISTDITYIPPRTGEARATLADSSKAKKDFRWEPTIELKNWMKENS